MESLRAIEWPHSVRWEGVALLQPGQKSFAGLVIAFAGRIADAGRLTQEDPGRGSFHYSDDGEERAGREDHFRFGAGLAEQQRTPAGVRPDGHLHGCGEVDVDRGYSGGRARLAEHLPGDVRGEVMLFGVGGEKHGPAVAGQVAQAGCETAEERGRASGVASPRGGDELGTGQRRTGVQVVLMGKVAVVIGGSGDIGSAIAEQVTHGGATTIITYLRDRAAAEEVVLRLAEQPGPAETAQLDATDATQVNALFDEVISRHGRVDIVVHLPGMVIKKSLVEISDADYT